MLAPRGVIAALPDVGKISLHFRNTMVFGIDKQKALY